jgi:quinol monooxygenase YgiN
MTFQPDKVKEFTDLFEERKATIRSFPGCTHLELWQDASHENVFFTYSNWNSIADLDHYRFSEFFKDTWGKTKALFAEKPQAWSVARRSVAD